MKKVGYSLLMLFVSCVYVVAQGHPDQTAKSSSSNPSTVQGCLGHSDNGYTLTDTSGTAYQLAGDTAKLSDHIGHEVEITGRAAASGEAPDSPTSATEEPAAPARIDVSSVKHISSTCSSKTDKGTEKRPMNGNPSMSERPPVPPPR